MSGCRGSNTIQMPKKKENEKIVGISIYIYIYMIYVICDIYDNRIRLF